MFGRTNYAKYSSYNNEKSIVDYDNSVHLQGELFLEEEHNKNLLRQLRIDNSILEQLQRARRDLKKIQPVVEFVQPTHVREALISMNPECPICRENMTLDTTMATPCGHVFHIECAKDQKKCPTCRRDLVDDVEIF